MYACKQKIPKKFNDPGRTAHFGDFINVASIHETHHVSFYQQVGSRVMVFDGFYFLTYWRQKYRNNNVHIRGDIRMHRGGDDNCAKNRG